MYFLIFHNTASAVHTHALSYAPQISIDAILRSARLRVTHTSTVLGDNEHGDSVTLDLHDTVIPMIYGTYA